MAALNPQVLKGDLQDQSHSDHQSALGVTRTETVTLPGIRSESGFEFKEVGVTYQTLGALSPARDNAILICPALTGDAHVAGLHPETGRPGWWDYHVGPGKAVDTNRFFVICASVLGGCGGTVGPSSTNPETGRSYAMSFPAITIRDIVAVQVKLLDWLGIAHLHAVLGASMGGMQALVWATDYPGRVKQCIPIATCAAHSAMQIAFNEIGRHAIVTDPDWQGGYYSPDRRPQQGLAVARMVGHVTYLSEFAMTHKFGRQRPLPESPETGLFAIESYLHHQGRNFVKRFDPNAYLYLTRAIDQFDLFARTDSDDFLKKVDTRFLVVSFASDWLYPPAQSRELVRRLKRASIPVTYVNLDTVYGHDSFLIENPPFANLLRCFLENEHRQPPVTGLETAAAAN